MTPHEEPLRSRRLARPLLLAVIGLLVHAFPLHAQSRPDLGIVGHLAPSWGVTEWLNLPDAAETLDVADHRGRVLYLYGFQSWCPGCHKHGFPTLQALIERYRDDESVAFVAIQTVFEGYASNTFARAKEIAEEYGLEIPVGQSGGPGQRSEFMRRYRTGGTPWAIIVDAAGVVRFNDFHIGVDEASRMIDALRRESRDRESLARDDANPDG